MAGGILSSLLRNPHGFGAGPSLEQPRASYEDDAGNIYDERGNKIQGWQPPSDPLSMYDVAMAPLTIPYTIAEALSAYGVEHDGLQVPPIIQAPIDAMGRLAENSWTEDGRPGIPDPRNVQNQNDVTTGILAMYGGNALNPLARVPRGAVASGAMKEAGPLRAYHGTSIDFEGPLNAGKSIGPHFGTAEQASNRAGFRDGWVNMNPSDNARVYPVDLHMQNPLEIRDIGKQAWTPEDLALAMKETGRFDGLYGRVGLTEDAAQKNNIIRDALRREGYDGISYRNTVEGDGLSYIATEPSTVKSATTGETLFSDTGKPSLLGSAVASHNHLSKQINDYLDEGIFLTKDDAASVSSMPMSSFNGKDIVASQTTVDPRTVKYWSKRIKNGDRPGVLIEETAPGKFKIVDGHSRATAYSRSGVNEVPVIIRSRGRSSNRFDDSLIDILKKYGLAGAFGASSMASQLKEGRQ